MFPWFKRKSCDLCKGKLRSPTIYLNQQGKEINVCFQCVPQAERKVLRRK